MKGMLNYCLVHAQVKSELKFKPKNLNFLTNFLMVI